MSDKNIVVIFPGTNYSAECPLLYYAGFKYEVRGYEKVIINYNGISDSKKTMGERIESAKSTVLEQLQKYDFTEYSDIVFAAKSIGTAIAGWAAEELKINARQICLTPIPETLPYIRNGKNINIVIAGTKDKYLDAEVLRQHCIKEGIELKQIDGVGHRLEIREDMDRNIEILREVVALY